MSDKNINAKKVLGFLLCTPAFTRRNITSMMLVGAFFFVYILAGGKIDTELPGARKASTFGGADSILSGLGGSGNTGTSQNENEQGYRQNVPAARQLLGDVTPQERRVRESASHTRGRVFTDEEADVASQDSTDRSGLIQGRYKSPESILERRAIEKSERRSADPLDAIEERLRQSK